MFETFFKDTYGDTFILIVFNLILCADWLEGYDKSCYIAAEKGFLTNWKRKSFARDEAKGMGQMLVNACCIKVWSSLQKNGITKRESEDKQQMIIIDD